MILEWLKPKIRQLFFLPPPDYIKQFREAASNIWAEVVTGNGKEKTRGKAPLN